MCSIKSIKLGVMILTVIKVILGAYITISGGSLATNTQIQQAYGIKFIDYGVALLFVGLISTFVVIAHWYANKRHNRFLLLIVFVLDLIVMSTVAGVAQEMATYLVPEFPKDLQNDCLRNTPQKYSIDECMPFYTSERTAGFRLFWQGYYTHFKDIKSFQVLSIIQGDLCCGFFPPLACIPNKDKFPSTFNQNGIKKSFLSQQVKCGPVSGFYPQTKICTDYANSASLLPVLGGCKWDLGVGFCTKEDVTTSTIGCASLVEDYVASQISPTVTFLSAACVINGISMLYACCMFWKRKESDVFPQLQEQLKVFFIFIYLFLKFYFLKRKRKI